MEKLEKLTLEELKKIHLDRYNNEEEELEEFYTDPSDKKKMKEDLIIAIRSYIEHNEGHEKIEEDYIIRDLRGQTDKKRIAHLKFKIQQKLDLQGAGIGVLDFEILNEIQDVINSF